ncbi:MAG: 50S ribosomal protein L25/general stress protein Ctc [Gammaproteobacteria bacterium]|nr:MAG: 50S ribosomal protein L25/general stress protein Ctc [Gammaproteobacteria bacterium]
MSDQISLAADERGVEGKSSSRALRRSGAIPCVLYGGKDEPLKISILEKEIVKAVEVPGFTAQIIKINLSGKEVDAVVKELQRHPATAKVLHADFMRVDPDSKITLTVPIRTINDDTCVGVKVNGGQVNHLINDIEIICLASNLPEFLEIDVQEMDIGDTVLLSGINLPEGVEIPALAQGEDRDQAVVSVTEAREIVIEEEVEEVALEGEEGEVAEGEAAEGDDSAEEPKEGGEEASEKSEDTKEG